jgi:hypothetical protein
VREEEKREVGGGESNLRLVNDVLVVALRLLYNILGGH